MTPILWSFRRCPYAMRARLALHVAEVRVDHREVVLRDKPAEFLATSPSATVPCLQTVDGVIDESRDIMIWALQQNDPEGWLDMPEAGHHWIDRCDGPFKHALDRTKYATRYPGEDPEVHRAKACAFLRDLDTQIDTQTDTQTDRWMFEKPTLADMAILPFVRQFAFIDKDWFDAQHWPNLQGWLARFLASARFGAIMEKHAPWRAP